MTQLINRQVLLAKHPEGDPTIEEFKINKTTVPELQDGEILIQTLYLSVDPGMRVLGVPGLCGYFGLFEIGHPKKGETVVVSGASGAVGSAAGQIAKAEGCRVVGIAGSDKKNQYLENELGFDATINYKTTDDMKKALQEACPDGIDIYFDTVGGEITHTVLGLINYHARVIICGQTSQYNLVNPPKISGDFNFLIRKSALMEGFVVYDYEDKNDEAVAYLEKLIREGKLKYKESVVDGIENAPQAFIDLFKGNSFGKQLVKVAE